jgi:NOL1/NOP2/sun family putative RNA methylase
MDELEFLYNYLEEEYPLFYKSIIDGYKTKRKTSFRINTLKSNKEEVENILNENNIEFTNVSWYKDAYVINDINSIRNLDIYKEGKIYVQSLSSMIPVLVLDPKENDHILDMTAAPGSKTTQIAALTNNEATITAVEKNKIRKDRLVYNLKIQGAKRVTVLNEDSRNIDDYFHFNKILLDAPCSGSGTIQLNDFKANQVFNKQTLDKICDIQYELLKKAVKLINKGDEIVYSTCSILKEENEYIINKILKEGQLELVPIKISDELPKLPTLLEETLCICPTDEFEGFFVAKLRKIN